MVLAALEATIGLCALIVLEMLSTAPKPVYPLVTIILALIGSVGLLLAAGTVAMSANRQNYGMIEFNAYMNRAKGMPTLPEKATTDMALPEKATTDGKDAQEDD